MLHKNNQRGFTFIEMITAITIFAFLMIMATGIFQSVVEGQRQAVNAQDVQESIRYAIEVMSKEIRTAQGDHDGSTCIPAAPASFKTYNTNETYVDGSQGITEGDELYFRNKDDQCVTYRLNGGQLEITRDGVALPITPDEVTVSNLEFTAVNDPAGAFHYLQGRVTIRMDVEATGGKEMDKQRMTVQTTVSSRFYE